MDTYIVIGSPGMGKTPFVKELIEGRRCLIFDINNEYGMRTKYPGQKPTGLTDNVNADRARYTGFDIKKFSQLVLSRRNTICVFEEATAFFRGRQKDETARILINRYHTGNVYVFLFHSINRVPPELMEMANYCVLFKTNDEEANVKGKFLTLLPHYQAIKQREPGAFEIIKLI